MFVVVYDTGGNVNHALDPTFYDNYTALQRDVPEGQIIRKKYRFVETNNSSTQEVKKGLLQQDYTTNSENNRFDTVISTQSIKGVRDEELKATE
jgi:hypothetical protein